MSTIEVIEGLQRRVALSVSTAELEQRATSKLRQLARTAKMQGFRPGKVPMKMIESMYGGSTRSEILSDLISEAFAKIAQEQQLRVAGTPDVSPEGELQFDSPSLQFSALFEVYPEVSLGPVGELEVERIHVQVGEAEIDKTVEVLRKQRTTWTEVDRPAVSGIRSPLTFVEHSTALLLTAEVPKASVWFLAKAACYRTLKKVSSVSQGNSACTFRFSFLKIMALSNSLANSRTLRQQSIASKNQYCPPLMPPLPSSLALQTVT